MAQSNRSSRIQGFKGLKGYRGSRDTRGSRDSRTYLVSLLLALSTANLSAQEHSTGYEFLKIPTSAHSAALGGNAVSIVEDDATLLFVNPAMLSYTANNTLNFNYTSYIASTNKLSAAFATQTGERGTIGFGASVLNYGTMTETDANMQTLGEFSANDIDIQGGYTYMLSDRWNGGVQGKVLMSKYGEFSSVAIGVDLGLHYYDSEKGWAVGLVGQNLGGQIKALHETREALPFCLAFGVSKELENAPIRITVTMPDITHWQNTFMHNLTLGCDIFPSRQTWLAISYNPLRAREMRTGTDDKSHSAGLALGGGLSLKKLKIGVGWGKYHVSASSLICNIAYSF